MVCGCKGLAVVTGAGAIAEAVGRVAEEGAAFGDVEEAEGMLAAEDNGTGPFSFLEEPVDLGLADSAGGTLGVGLGVFGEDFVEVGAVVVGAMFPDVSGHVVEAEGIWWVGFDRGGAGEAVFAGVVVWEFSGEDVGEPFFAGLGFGSPNVVEFLLTTASGEFPFGFGGETFAGPFGVGIGIFPGDTDDGVVVFSFDVRFEAGGVLPGSSVFKTPPLPFGAFALEFDGSGWAGEDESTGLERFGRGFGEVFDRPAFFGLGLVAGGIDEFFKLGVRDFGGVDIEATDGDFVNGAFFGVVGEFGVFLGATGVGFSFDEDHAIGCGAF